MYTFDGFGNASIGVDEIRAAQIKLGLAQAVQTVPLLPLEIPILSKKLVSDYSPSQEFPNQHRQEIAD